MPSPWPAGISFIDRPDDYSEEGPHKNVIRTPMDKGPVKRRRRFTAASRMISGSTNLLTDADVVMFEDWFDNTIASGALSFEATHPRTRVTTVFAFYDDPPYEIIREHEDMRRIRMKLEVLP